MSSAVQYAYLTEDSRLYRIVGVLEESRTGHDHEAFAPPVDPLPTTAGVRRTIRNLHFTVADRRSLDAAREQLTEYFDAAYGEGLLHVSDPRAQARLIAGRFRGMVQVVLFLSVSLLAISTLYLANIFAGRALRKRRSAGILKAMGAAAGGVFAVFAAEAAVIAAIGGAAGLGARRSRPHSCWRRSRIEAVHRRRFPGMVGGHGGSGGGARRGPEKASATHEAAPAGASCTSRDESP